MKKLTGFMTLTLLLCLSFFGTAFAADVVIKMGGTATVIEVVDGETLRVAISETDTALVKLIGVDAKSNAAAVAYLNGLVGQTVSLSFDPVIASPADGTYNVMYVTYDGTLVNRHMIDVIHTASKTAHVGATMFTNAVYTPAISSSFSSGVSIGTSTGTATSASTWNNDNWYLRNGRYYYYMNGLFYIYNSDGTYSPTRERLTVGEKTVTPPINYQNSYLPTYFDPYYYNSSYYYGAGYYSTPTYSSYGSYYNGSPYYCSYNCYECYNCYNCSDCSGYYNRSYYDSGRAYYYDRYGNKVYYNNDPCSYYYNDYYYDYYDYDYYYNNNSRYGYYDRDCDYYGRTYPYNLYTGSRRGLRP